MELRVVRDRDFPEEEENETSKPKKDSSQTKSKPQSTPLPLSTEQTKPRAQQKPLAQQKEKAKAKASKSSQSDQSTPKQSLQPKKKKVKPRKYFLVIATLGKVPRCEVCSTTDEIRQHLQTELHSSVASDIHAWLFHGHKLTIPAIGEYDLDLSFTDAAGQKLKIFDSSEAKADDLSGRLVRPGEGNLVADSESDSDDDELIDDDTFIF